MSNRRTLMAAAAVVLALVAGIGVYLYASGADKRAADDAGLVHALVATSDIAKGTTGEEAIQAGLVHEESVAKGSVPPSIVSDLHQLTGKVAAARIDDKQFITATTFVANQDGPGGQFANAIASQNLVAVSVNVDTEHGVANQITPGDHVDIASSVTAPDGSTAWGYLLNNVKVLAVGPATVQQQASTTSDATPAQPDAAQPGLLTFEVTPTDALRLIAANSGGSRIYLTLLPSADGAATSPTSSTTSGASGSKTTASKAPANKAG